MPRPRPQQHRQPAPLASSPERCERRERRCRGPVGFAEESYPPRPKCRNPASQRETSARAIWPKSTRRTAPSPR
eukprot:s1032_g2.t1